MLLTVLTLSKLTVSAKLLCLLMVSTMMVICGAVPSMVRSVRLYNQCSFSYVQIDSNGTVRATGTSDDRLQNLTITSQDFKMGLKIYSEAVGKYLCFNKRFKLVGKKKFVKKWCEFKELLRGAYTQYRLASNESRYMGFTHKGRPVRGACSARHSRRRECGCCKSSKAACEEAFKFLKEDNAVNIGKHNEAIGKKHPPHFRHHGHRRVGAARRRDRS